MNETQKQPTGPCPMCGCLLPNAYGPCPTCSGTFAPPKTTEVPLPESERRRLAELGWYQMYLADLEMQAVRARQKIEELSAP